MKYGRSCKRKVKKRTQTLNHPRLYSTSPILFPLSTKERCSAMPCSLKSKRLKRNGSLTAGKYEHYPRFATKDFRRFRRLIELVKCGNMLVANTSLAHFIITDSTDKHNDIAGNASWHGKKASGY